jgi:hypothetical protein
MYEGRSNTRFVEKGWVGLASHSERALCSLSEIRANSILNNLSYPNAVVQSIYSWFEGPEYSNDQENSLTLDKIDRRNLLADGTSQDKVMLSRNVNFQILGGSTVAQAKIL